MLQHRRPYARASPILGRERRIARVRGPPGYRGGPILTRVKAFLRIYALLLRSHRGRGYSGTAIRLGEAARRVEAGGGAMLSSDRLLGPPLLPLVLASVVQIIVVVRFSVETLVVKGIFLLLGRIRVPQTYMSIFGTRVARWVFAVASRLAFATGQAALRGQVCRQRRVPESSDDLV